MSASSRATVAVLLMASALLSASLARMSGARPDARWTVASSAFVGVACASLASLHSLIGG